MPVDRLAVAILQCLDKSLDQPPGVGEFEVVLPWGGSITVKVKGKEGKRIAMVYLDSSADCAIIIRRVISGNLVVDKENMRERAMEISERVHDDRKSSRWVYACETHSTPPPCL